MEQCFRIAFWMSFLVVCLQAAAIRKCSSIKMGDLGVNLLRENIKCDKNVSFTSPSNVSANCSAEALEAFKKGLSHARTECEGNKKRISQTEDTLVYSCQNLSPAPTQAGPSGCKWETKDFTVFLNDLEAFVTMLNTENNPI